MFRHNINSYLSILSDDNANIFAASLFISSFSLSSSLRVIFYILSERFFLKPKELSDAIVQWVTGKKYVLAVRFL